MQGSYIILELFNIVSCKVHISFLDCSILYHARFIYCSWTIQYCILQGSYTFLGLFNIVYESKVIIFVRKEFKKTEISNKVK